MKICRFFLYALHGRARHCRLLGGGISSVDFYPMTRRMQTRIFGGMGGDGLQTSRRP